MQILEGLKTLPFYHLVQLCFYFCTISYVLSLVCRVLRNWSCQRSSEDRAMTHVVTTTKDINPQHDCPLFSILPPEIRNSIFELALTAYEDPSNRYRRDVFFYRPGHTCFRKIDTNLLLTCRRVYAETASLPASINEHVSWYWRGPPVGEKNHVPAGPSVASSRRRRELRRIHLFAQQFWLESSRGQVDGGFRHFTKLWNFVIPCPIRPTHLKITIRHTDWWWWEHGHLIALDPKQPGRPSAARYSRPSDPFDDDSWGAQFRRILGLKCLQLELETVERKMGELDAIVQQAKGWKFSLGDHQVLVLDESRTRRTGWIGKCFCHSEICHEKTVCCPANGPGRPPNYVEMEVDWHDLLPEQADQTTLHEVVNNDAPSDVSAADDAGPLPAAKVPLTARQRLEATGVQFHEEESWNEKLKDFGPRETCPYYVVTLTWLAHRE